MLALGVLLAFGSGLAALIYEVVWFQILELVVGSTALALAILLATFMGGMCLGSWLFPRVFSARRNSLRAYALIELGIGICGLLVLHVVSLAPLPSLIPPTVLMGATLPALARISQAARDHIPWLGIFYAANIAGAMLGSLIAGFYLLRLYDVTVASYAAAGINLAMAGIAAVAAGTSRESNVPPPETAFPARESAVVYVAIALSGLCALAAEAIWTRLLGLLFGANVYAFSIIVAVFLAGLGIGSGLGALLSRARLRPRLALGCCQILAVPAMAWAAYNLDAALPYARVDPSIFSDVWRHFQFDLARTLWALLPATIFWGASFSLALRAAGGEDEDTGQLMARVYAANTLGAIAGALGASLLLIAWIGSQHAVQALMVISAIAGILLLGRWGLIAAAAGIAILSIASVPPVAKVLIAYGRYAASWAGKSDIVYAREGRNSSVAVARFSNGAVTFHVAGKIQASNVPRDMRLQRMLGHLTTLINTHPRSVLVIGCGAGVTAGAVSIDPRVERETVVEIEPLVVQAAAKYFSGPNFGVLGNPKVQVRIGDGRHYLARTRERFDGITIDPLDPWVKGAAAFYTREFFETLQQHLEPGGVVTLYIQLFETDLQAVKSAVATFFDVFPNGTMWGNPYRGQGHDMVLLGTVEPLRINLDEMEQRIGYRGGNSPVASSLAEIGMNSPVDLFATYAARKADLEGWLRGAAVNHDWNLRMQYLAGLGLDRDDAASIYAGILAHRHFPDNVFSSADGRVAMLREAILRQAVGRQR